MTLQELIQWNCTLSFPTSEFRKFCNNLSNVDQNALTAQIAGVVLPPMDPWGFFLTGYAQVVGLGAGMNPQQAGKFKAAIFELFHTAKTPAEQLRFFQISSQCFWLGRDSLMQFDPGNPWDPWLSFAMRSWWDVPVPHAAAGDSTQAERAFHRYMGLMTGTDKNGASLPDQDFKITPNDRLAEHLPAFKFLIARLEDRDPVAARNRYWNLVPDPNSREAPLSTWTPNLAQKFKRWYSGKTLLRHLPPAAVRWKAGLLVCWSLTALALATIVYMRLLPIHS